MSRRLLRRLRSWLGNEPPPSDDQIDRLRASFKSRYNAFRLLLTANQRALEAMRDIESVLDGIQPVDHSFIQHRYTQVAAAVYYMIGCLEKVHPGESGELIERFRLVQDRIDAILDIPEPDPDLPLVLPLRGLTAADSDLVGAEMALLGDLSTAIGAAIPTGFVTTARAYHEMMTHRGLGAEIRRLIQIGGVDEPRRLAETSRRVRNLISGTTLPEDLEQALIESYRSLRREAGADMVLLMRSSAVGEDTPGCSHAGIYQSVFDVTGSTLIRSFKRVVASKYSPQAMHYRLHAGLREDTEGMCVWCTPIVDSVAGGVTYTRNPLDPNDEVAIVHSSWGLPRTVLAGSDGVDVFTVSRFNLTTKGLAIGEKRHRYVLSAARRRCELEQTGKLASEASLTEEQAAAIAEVALEIERHRGEPQDVEWALARDGSIVVLQSRALSVIPTAQTPERSIDGQPLGEVLLTGGVTASPGLGVGPAKTVRNERDARRFPAGAVLVAHQAVADWIPALDRAAAIVTEIGGVANHLATVAREFGVPALFGVDGASTAIDAGLLVMVDATNRIIYHNDSGEEGVNLGPNRRRIVRGPIHQTLARVAEHVVRLTLLDPDAPEFDPVGCQSLHDITRYCHERAMQAMFRFGAEHEFPGAAARQLKCGVPIQFWIVDLGDGLRKSAGDTGYIHLDDLLSIPSLALCRGMTTVAWGDPPTVSHGGFVDAMLQSTNTPGLEPAAPFRLSQQNYLMISRCFCSLQSRFGCHSATVEALVGDRAMENYAWLQFKAGGASHEQKNRRARLIADVLAEQQFSTITEGDLTRARIEGLSRESMEQRLVGIGHLLVHAPQLDMAMTNEHAIDVFRSRIIEQLEQLTVEGP